jgi:GNAT superfamily N-acetyltransferase
MIGQLGYYVFDSIGEIDEFYVAEDHQKQGVGKTLFLHAIQLLQSQNVKTIMLVTDPTSDAYKIYQRWGFENILKIYQTRIQF